MARKTEQTWLRPAVTLILMLLVSSLAWADGDDDLEYKMDMGVGLGPCFYMGDANSTPYSHMSMMGGFTVRRIFNPRMALKSNLAIGHLAGSSDGKFIPRNAYSETAAGGNPTVVKFSRNVVDLGAQFEMNFWGFGSGAGYKGTSRITPYALMGAGITMGMGGGGGTCFGLNFPVGVGVKYKLMPRVNIGMEWTMRFTTSDQLDNPSKGQTYLIHPYGMESKGLKNKDCYNFTMFFITYEMCPKLRRCNN